MYLFAACSSLVHHQSNTSMDALLSHHMDLYEESSVATNYEGKTLVTNFGTLYRFWMRLVTQKTRCVHAGFQNLSTNTVARLISLAIGNCVKLQELLDKETNTQFCPKS